MKSRKGVASEVVQHAAGAAVAILVLGVVSMTLVRSASTQASVRNAEEQTRVMAVGIVNPVLTDGVLTSSAAAIAALDEVANLRLLPSGATRVKIWDGSGQVLYSDEHRLIGQRFGLDEGELTVLKLGGSHAGVSDLDEPENRYEQRDRRLLEVYRRIETPNGTPLLFEAYFPYAVVEQSRDALWREYNPIFIGTLVVLVCVEVPLGWLLARRIRRSQVEREALLHRAIKASEDERQRIARDLHDGIVQDLAGVSFMIAGTLDQLGPDVDPHAQAALREAATVTRLGIRQLRTLLVDLIPPTLAREGLESALTDLLARAQSNGVATSLSIDSEIRLNGDSEALAFRVVQEAMRNMLQHSEARNFDVKLESGSDGPRLEVSDDGCGFDVDSARLDGHFGLQLLGDSANRLDATLTIRSAPGQGTQLLIQFVGSR